MSCKAVKSSAGTKGEMGKEGRSAIPKRGVTRAVRTADGSDARRSKVSRSRANAGSTVARYRRRGLISRGEREKEGAR